jgi:hypothetical protein
MVSDGLLASDDQPRTLPAKSASTRHIVSAAFACKGADAMRRTNS